jgi:hypothetical protein
MVPGLRVQVGQGAEPACWWMAMRIISDTVAKLAADRGAGAAGP